MLMQKNHPDEGHAPNSMKAINDIRIGIANLKTEKSSGIRFSRYNLD